MRLSISVVTVFFTICFDKVSSLPSPTSTILSRVLRAEPISSPHLTPLTTDGGKPERILSRKKRWHNCETPDHLPDECPPEPEVNVPRWLPLDPRWDVLGRRYGLHDDVGTGEVDEDMGPGHEEGGPDDGQEGHVQGYGDLEAGPDDGQEGYVPDIGDPEAILGCTTVCDLFGCYCN